MGHVNSTSFSDISISGVPSFVIILFLMALIIYSEVAFYTPLSFTQTCP